MENTIITGDCIEIMRKMENKSIDLVLTDPPYNAKNIGPHQRTYSLGTMQLPEKEYKKFCKEWFKEALRVGKALVFTPGIANVCFYPQPYWILCWHKPAAVSFNRMGGFNAWEPIMVYGKTAKGKRLGQDYILVNTLNLDQGPRKNHPCPKPPLLIKKLIDVFSNEGDLILDPFNGSGTTTWGAKQMGRRFIGIDINSEYNKIAESYLQQEMLFSSKEKAIPPSTKVQGILA